jgi:hypothetical protein
MLWIRGLRSLAVAAALLPLVVGCGDSRAPATSSGEATEKVPARADKSRAGGESEKAAQSTGGESEPAPVQRSAPLYRASEALPRHDDARLGELGIHKYTSQRLHLYSDLPAEKVRALPDLMDRAYDAWVEYFGDLPPDREGSEFVLTGYLMVNQALFHETGLLPEDLPFFPHGRFKGRRFWMNEQPTDYYRRHLLIHEGTHCFMSAVSNPLTEHVWYMEGMAELFGTHRFDADGRPRFRVLPHDAEQFPHWGRIRLVNEEVRASGPRELSSVLEMESATFLANPAYAWSWALCQFLDGHPRYHERFQRVASAVTTGARTDDWNLLFKTDRADLEEEWLLFAAGLCFGYDQQRAVIDFRAGEPLHDGKPATIEVAADRGWQSSGVQVEHGKEYRVTATGRFTIANARPATDAAEPAVSGSAADRPWESEPQGISFRYHAGRPIGMLVAAIRSVPQPENPPRTTLLDVIPIGRDATFTAPVTGTVYLRINDDWSSLQDNAGQAKVTIRRTTNTAGNRTQGPTNQPQPQSSQ